MRWKALTASTASLAVAAALAAAATADGGPSPGVETGWNGILARNGDVRYVAVTTNRGDTVVEAIRTRDGRVLRWSSLHGVYGIPLVAYDGSADGLSRDGKTLVLATYAGLGSRVTRFAILTTRLHVVKIVTLPGVWSYDALSPDASTLYLIQYTSVTNQARYRVRAYDLVANRLLPQAIVDKTDPEPMVGQPMTRATTANGTWAYTLYSRPADKPFVHALDTVRRVARCIDLDAWKGTNDDLWKARLVLSGDGRKLLLRMHGKTVLVVDTTSFRVRA